MPKMGRLCEIVPIYVSLCPALLLLKNKFWGRGGGGAEGPALSLPSLVYMLLCNGSLPHYLRPYVVCVSNGQSTQTQTHSHSHTQLLLVYSHPLRLPFLSPPSSPSSLFHRTPLPSFTPSVSKSRTLRPAALLRTVGRPPISSHLISRPVPSTATRSWDIYGSPDPDLNPRATA